MSNVIRPDAWWAERQPPPSGPTEPPRMDLTERVSKLEATAQDTRDRLVRIEMRLENIDGRMSNQMATKDGVKADVADAKNSVIMWVVSTILLAQLLPALLKKFGL